MSKICILGDCHIGARSGSINFHDYFEKFYSRFLFPYLLENNITTIIQLGDLWDNRKAAHLYSADRSKVYLFDELKKHGITFYTLLGNHDIFYKESLSVNSSSLLLQYYDNIHIINEPTTIEEFEIDLIPWICKENESEVFSFIQDTKSSICMGHFEIQSFSMYKGVESKHGIDPDLFKKFEYVFSGHYHHKSNKGNIYYVGTPYEITWQDCSDPRGFHILDTVSRKLEFFENPFKMFHKIEYSNDIEFSNLDQYKDTYVKVLLKGRDDDFDVFLDHLNQVNPIDVTVIEEVVEIDVDDEVIDETQDTLTIMGKYIDGIKNKELDSDKLKNIMTKLYEEAVRLESI